MNGLLCGTDSRENAFLTTTILTSSSLGLAAIFPVYPHKLHFLLLLLIQQTSSVTLYLE